MERSARAAAFFFHRIDVAGKSAVIVTDPRDGSEVARRRRAEGAAACLAVARTSVSRAKAGRL
jgi:hypothetical protein